MKTTYFIVLFFLVLGTIIADDTFIMKPLPNKGGNDIALIMIQGAQCEIVGYKPVLSKIQETFSGKLWIGAPQFIQNLPEPAQFGSKVDEVVKTLKSSGMPSNATIVYLAHSLGGVMSQLHLTGDKPAADALILYGSTILRKYRSKSAQFKLPVLTIDGDLDGLLRITRQAEAYYHQVTQDETGNYPVVLLPGLSHWSISSGTPPSNVKSNDLVPEVTEDEGHAQLASTVATFLASKFSNGVNKDAVDSLNSLIAATGDMVAPLIEGFKMEGYQHLTEACNSDFPSNPTCNYPKYPDKCLIPGTYPSPPNPLPPSDCTCGSPWVQNVAHNMMGALDESPAAAWNAIISSKDAFHDVSDVRPFHLPHTFSPVPGKSCKTDTSLSKCILNTTTVTMPIYDIRDKLDTGLYPVAATEFRTKMKSRSALWGSAGVNQSDIDYNKLDKNNLDTCGAINEAAYKWALDKASQAAKDRFTKNGQPYVFVKDVYEGIGITGPKWIKSALKFTVSDDKKTVQVASPTFSTADKNLGDASYLDPVGFHYCKLLSPAAALEWIYVDGLRQFGGLKTEKDSANVAQVSGCPDLASLGAKAKSTDFDVTKASGVWYENAYEDIAQVGASCQVFTNEISGKSSGDFQQTLKTKYGVIPFSQTYTYEQGTQRGLYTKYLNGAKSLLTLPTVIIDAKVGDDGNYEHIVEFTCKSVLGVKSTELRISSRSRVMDTDTLEELKQKATDAGVPADIVAKLKTNDYTKCH